MASSVESAAVFEPENNQNTSLAIVRGPQRPDLIRPEGLADLFEASAATYPDKPALTFGCQTLTYSALNQQSSQLADQLMRLGAGPGQLVGLWMTRGLDLLIAQLAIAKTGAGWLPLDADIPTERIAVCLEDAQAIALLTSEALTPVVEPVLAPLGVACWQLETLRAQVEPDPQHWRQRPPTQPDDLAYVIYTSGSTGKPKGILIGQGGICHFLRSENERLGVTADDLVYQGFSVAFDMSFEEIWISYLVGASLWIAPKAIVADPDALFEALNTHQITVLHAVPTLVALLPSDVPSLRLINLGGEMCPDAVVRRFGTTAAHPQRQLFNTYGPTEATVSASLAQLQPEQPVTIGTPLPNYGMLIRSDAGDVLALEETGELCIFGPGVALGYLGRPDLTAAKFIDNPITHSPDESRLYRTGDLARIGADGQVYCLGRADDQVKVRGFRVELGEIEAALCDLMGIGTAAVVLRSLQEVEQLVAFIVPDEAEPEAADALTLTQLRQQLRQRLPSYMVPAHFEWLTDAMVPRLPSGKIDRNALKIRPLTPQAVDTASDEPVDAVETALFQILRQFFGLQAIRLSADFFDDLGGHSLLAARLITQIRQEPAYQHVTIADIYQGRTVQAIAERMRQGHVQRKAQPAAYQQPYRPPTKRRWAAGIVQGLLLPWIVGLQIMKWLAPFFMYHYLTGSPTDSIARAMGWSLLIFLFTQLLAFAVSILGHRLLMSRAKPGIYPLWGPTYLRWWLADRLSDLAPTYLLAGSSLYPTYLRALGARIGKQTEIGSVNVRVPHLLTVGSRVDIGNGVNLENARVEQGWLHLGQITLEDDAFIGSYTVLEGNTAIEKGGYLDGLSALADGETVPAGQGWQGAPAQVMANLPPPMPARPEYQAGQRLGHRLFYIVGMVAIACLFFLPIFPTFIMVDWLDDQIVGPIFHSSAPHFVALRYFILAIPAAALMILLTALLSAAIRWLAIPRLQPGTYPVHGSLYRRKWLANQIQESSLQVLHGVYATVYAPSWYRLLGAKVGKNAEISTAMGVVPDMLTLGEDSFIADAVMLGDEEVRQGWMVLKPTVIGHRTFVGNGAYVPDGSVLPDQVLIGVQSRVPDNERMQTGQTWFGTPPMHLPARETQAGFASHLTFAPSLIRRLGRAFVEGMRIVLPLAFVTGVGYMIVLEVFQIDEDAGLGMALLALAGCGVLYGIGSVLFVAALKWLFLQRYETRSQPMWTGFVWLSEAVTSLYESIVVPNLANYLRGTPYLNWVMRLFGAHLGRHVWLDSTDMTEFDCVHIGDYSELNNRTGPQTHLFEDRVMKIGSVRIGQGVTVRARGTVLYDTQVGDHVVLGPMTLVMKGEHIPANSTWSGSPAQRLN